MIPFSAEAVNNLVALERKHYYISTYPKHLIVIGDRWRSMESKGLKPEPCCTIGGFFPFDEKLEAELVGPYIEYPFIAIAQCPTLLEARSEATKETRAAVALMLMGDKR